MNDYIKLNRCIKHNWLWTEGDDPFDKRSAWVDLLLLASWKDEKSLFKGKLVVFKRGTVHKSILELANRWHWDRKKVRKFLDLLESDNMVVTKSTRQGTTITIVNWDLYQCDRTTDGTTTTPTTTPTMGQRLPQRFPIIEEGKESKEGKEGKNNIPPYSPPKGKTTKQKKADKNIELFDKMFIGFGFSDRIMDKMLDWMRYKGEEKGFEYKETGLKALLTQVKQNVDKYGDSAVIDCINLSMSNGWQGILWDKLKEAPKGNGNNGYTFMDYIEDNYYDQA